jgi:hypothetical protein
MRKMEGLYFLTSCYLVTYNRTVVITYI